MSSLATQTCDLCSGSGWLPLEGTLNAKPCVCQGELRRRQRAGVSQVPKRYYHCTLSQFHDRGNPSLIRAKQRVLELIECWPGGDRGLLLIGGCGVGKTHLAVAALHEIISSGKPGRVLFSNFQDLIQEIHASFGSDQAPTKSEILQPVLDAELLVLDELGSQKPTAFIQDILYYIINSRYNDERVTIFTTNYSDNPRTAGEETLEQRIGERLRSRLHEMTERVVIESVDDYRKSVSGRRI